MEINPAGGSTMKTYVYANSQILMQHNGAPAANNKYFYLHDRLGSVREVIDSDGDVVNSYTYNPFGEMFPTECTENVSNPFKFTGQWFDSEIEQYYLRARMYDPALMRFTARDPVIGKNQEPLTLHKYLYCLNNSINHTDPSGEWTTSEVSFSMGIQGFVYGSILGGVRSAFLDESVWKGALSGGLAVGTPAFLGVYGVAAAMMAGGIDAGFSAALNGQGVERIIADSLAGIAIGSITYGLGTWCIDNFMAERMVSVEFDAYFHRFLDPCMGSVGSDVWKLFKRWLEGESEDGGGGG
jgi:RHS repeat-associated protein